MFSIPTYTNEYKTHSGLGSNSNEGVLDTPQTSKSGASLYWDEV